MLVCLQIYGINMNKPTTNHFNMLTPIFVVFLKLLQCHECYYYSHSVINVISIIVIYISINFQYYVACCNIYISIYFQYYVACCNIYISHIFSILCSLRLFFETGNLILSWINIMEYNVIKTSGRLSYEPLLRLLFENFTEKRAQSSQTGSFLLGRKQYWKTLRITGKQRAVC